MIGRRLFGRATLAATAATLDPMSKKTKPLAATHKGALRATVVGNGTTAGANFTILVDGSDSTITCNGMPGYLANDTDRILVSQVGKQVQMLAQIGGPRIITAGVFQTDVPGNPAIVIENSTDPLFNQGGVIKFNVTGLLSGWASGTINAQWSDDGAGTTVGTLTMLGPVPPGGHTVPGIGLSFVDVSGTTNSTLSLDAHTIIIGANAAGGIFMEQDSTVVGDFNVTGDGLVGGKWVVNGNLTAESALFDQDTTTSTNVANVVILGTDRIVTHTSSSAQKMYQADLDLSTATDHIVHLRPRTWLDRLELEGHFDAKGVLVPGRNPDDVHRTAGFFVEETTDELLTDHGPAPDVDLQHVIADLVRLVQDQQRRLDALEATPSP